VEFSEGETMSRTETKNMKAMISTQTDTYRAPYGRVMKDVPRRCVFAMTTNQDEYLKDESGNRRFYPIFLGQLPDRMNKPQWRDDFRIDFNGFREDFWMIMAECRAWMAHYKVAGYEKYVRSVVSLVKDFNAGELRRDSGTIADDSLDMYLVPMIERSVKNFCQGQTTKTTGMFIATAALMMCYDKFDRKNRINLRHLKVKMEALGAISTAVKSGSVRGYLFRECKNQEDLMAYIETVFLDPEGIVLEEGSSYEEITPVVEDGEGGF